MSGKLNPMPFWLLINQGCPYDQCFLRKGCKVECHRFTAWTKAPVRAGIRRKTT